MNVTNPMHVVVAAHDFYPDPGSGGSGRYVFETAKRLVERGHRVSVVTRRRGAVPERERVAGIDVYRYDLQIADRAAPTVLWQVPSALETVEDHVSHLTAEKPPDVLSVQGPVAGLLVERALDHDVARVPTFHSPWATEYCIRTRDERSRPRQHLNAAIRRRLERRVLGDADRVLALSEFMLEQMTRQYAVESECAIVPGGVDLDRYTPDAGPTDLLDGGDPAFLTVRRLAERMGHDLLLDAFATVVEHHPDAHLYVAGDGPLRNRLARTARSLGIADGVTFLGYVPDEELPDVYADADLFVLPTRELEGFGLATLEALASGTPVVATPVGGSVEVLSELDERPEIPAEVLLPAVDADVLATALLDWANRSADELATASAVCRRYAAAQYDWERTATRLEVHYADVCSRAQNRERANRVAEVGPAENT